jgi:septal ring factor EnvC (AmiA/AmiB activator)
MDSVYESFIRQIAGTRLEVSTKGILKDAVTRDKRRQKLQKEIASLENNVRKERQFNRQVELNGELKRLKKEWRGWGERLDGSHIKNRRSYSCCVVFLHTPSQGFCSKKNTSIL